MVLKRIRDWVLRIREEELERRVNDALEEVLEHLAQQEREEVQMGEGDEDVGDYDSGMLLKIWIPPSALGGCGHGPVGGNAQNGPVSDEEEEDEGEDEMLEIEGRSFRLKGLKRVEDEWIDRGIIH